MKSHKPLSSKKPPTPSADHQLIEAWIENARPVLFPILRRVDELVRKQLDAPCYAIKWSNAYYGTLQKGWCIELAAYDISANIVFLNGNRLSPPPELGDETRYVKIRRVEELESPQIQAWIRQSCETAGWAG